MQNGWVQPAHRASRLALARSRHDQWKKRGAPVEMLSREQVAAITGSSFWHGGWLNRSGGHINPLAFARGLAGAALSHGVRLHTRSPVTASSAAARIGSRAWATPPPSRRAA